MFRRLRKRLDAAFPRANVNFWCHVVEGVFASTSQELMDAGVVFPILAGALGASPSLIGALTALWSLSFLAPLLTAHRIETSRHKRFLVLALGAGYYPPLLLVVLALLLLGSRAPLACVVVVALLLLVRRVFVAMIGPTWFDLLSETIPRRSVGRLFGYRHAVAALMGIFSGSATAALLRGFGFPVNYALVYLLGFAAMVASQIVFALVDEVPPHVVSRERPSHGVYLRDLFAILRVDSNYRRFLAYQVAESMGMIVTPFFALAATWELGGDQGLAAGGFVIASSLAKIAGNLAFPLLARRTGDRRLMQAGLVVGAAGAGMAALAPSWEWFFGVYFLMGLVGAIDRVAGMPFRMGVFPRGRRIGYQTLTSVVTSPILLAAGPLAGAAFGRLGRAPVFAAAAAILLVAILPLSACTSHPSQQ